MLRKVFKTGNSVVVSIPQDALDYLGLAEGRMVAVDLDRQNRQIVISPVLGIENIPGVDETFARQVNDFIEKYRSALETLASK